jgi:hypothetical protein
MNKSLPILLILLSVTISLAVFLFVPAIPQDRAYHDFADQRVFWGIPNFFNVASNLPLFIIGFLGIHQVSQLNSFGNLLELRKAYFAFFAGVFLTGMGSAFYHLSPANDSLVWDRMPMIIAFMALFAIVVGEIISAELANRMLYPLIVLGMLSVVYWFWSEQNNQGDLRFYGLIQFLPLLLIPIILLAGKTRSIPSAYIWALLVSYAAAKMAEFGDLALFQEFGYLSGHTIKHLLAALGVWFVILGLKKRTASV